MKRRFLSFCAFATVAISVTACNNTGTTSGTTDSSNNTSSTNTTSTTNSTMTATSSVGNYAAMADTVEKNSQQGYYLNPKTGKPYKSLKVDRTTGRISDETGEPVWRYVDNRNWWVYGDKGTDTTTTWSQVGEAKMDKDKLTYHGDGDKWVNYDDRWMKDDEMMVKKWKSSDNGMKQKVTTENGDKIKIKTDEDGNLKKIKVNGDKMKMGKDSSK